MPPKILCHLALCRRRVHRPLRRRPSNYPPCSCFLAPAASLSRQQRGHRCGTCVADSACSASPQTPLRAASCCRWPMQRWSSFDKIGSLCVLYIFIQPFSLYLCELLSMRAIAKQLCGSLSHSVLQVACGRPRQDPSPRCLAILHKHNKQEGLWCLFLLGGGDNDEFSNDVCHVTTNLNIKRP